MPEGADGTVDASKAVSINEQFQISRQYWAHLVSTGALPEPHNFINSTPHSVKGVRTTPADSTVRRILAAMATSALTV